MIGKQIKGTNFRGVLNYLHVKEGARLIGGNMAGKNPRTLAAEFRLGRELNPNLKRAVYHASLSLPKTESLDDERWRAIASDYLRGMGFEGSQYVIYRHSDRSHDHIHLVACRIRITDGSTVSDSWDYRRSEELIRSLEKQYQLEAVPSSRERETRAPTTGEWRRKERTSQVGVRTRLQTLIDKATQNCPTMPQFIHRLKEQGVDVRVGYTRALQVKGISYSLEGIAFSGTHLGKAYTFPGLQKYRGVSYDMSQDEEIRAVSALEPVNPSIAPETLKIQIQPPLDYYQQVRQLKRDAERILWQYGVRENPLKSYGTFEGQKYRIVSDEQAFRIISKDGRGEILNYPDDPYTSHAEVRAQANFTQEDVDLFRTVASQIAQQREKASQQCFLQTSPERELER